MLIKQEISLATLSASNLLAIFFFQLYVLQVLGPGLETDAFFAGSTIPQIALNLLVGPLMNALVPLLTARPPEEARQLAWSILLSLAGIFSVIALLLGLTTPYWTALLFPGFNAETLELTQQLASIQLLGMIFSSCNAAQWALHHSRSNFVNAEFRPLLASLISLGVLVVTLPIYGIVAAAWVGILRLGLQTLFLAKGFGWPYRLQYDGSFMRELWRRIRPLLLSGLYYKSELIIDRFLLSSTQAGNLSVYHFALQLMLSANSILHKALAAPLMTRLSHFAKSKHSSKFKQTYRNSLLKNLLVTGSAYLLLAWQGQALLGLVVGYGNFNDEDIYRLWEIMMYLGGILIAGSSINIATSAHYAKGDTRTPAIIGAVTYTLYIPLKIYAFVQFGLIGLAATTSLQHLIVLLVNMARLDTGDRDRNE